VIVMADGPGNIRDIEGHVEKGSAFGSDARTFTDVGDFKKRVADFFRRVSHDAVPSFDHARVAFYGVQNEKIVKDRTGVLLRIADAMFILTASHDLREIVQNNIPLYISWNERSGLPIPLHDSRFLTTEYESQLGERDVVRDVAAIKLGESAVKEILTGGRIPLSLCDINTNQDNSPALFVMFGFPQAWFDVDQTGPKCSPLIYQGFQGVIRFAP
jgi:hypothetical protein